MFSKAKHIICMIFLTFAAGLSCAGDRLDPSLEAAAKCTSTVSIAPSLAAYRLLLSSKVVVKEKKGPLTFYMAGMDRLSGVRIWNMNPTRIVVVERDGLPNALVGTLYSKDFPLSDRDIVGSFQGGLKRKIDLKNFSAPQLSTAGVSSAQVSIEPVSGQQHLMAGKLATGERLLICASIKDLEAFVK
jgi:hypothetical protein